MMLKTLRSATVPSSPASGLFFRCSGSCSSRPAAAHRRLLDALELVGASPRAARIPDFLLPRHGVEHGSWEISSRAPKINLKGQGVAARLALDDPLQRRDGNATSGPIMLAFRFNCGNNESVFA